MIGIIYLVLAVVNGVRYWHTTGDSWTLHLIVSLILIVLANQDFIRRQKT